MGFEELPAELILAIGEQSNSLQDLLNLVKTSRGFRNILENILVRYSVEHDYSHGLYRAVLLNDISTAKQFLAYPGITGLEVHGLTREQSKEIKRLIQPCYYHECEFIYTPLFLAIYLDHEDMACLLLDSGVIPSVFWESFHLALTLAVTMKHEKCVRQLLKKGANHDIQAHLFRRLGAWAIWKRSLGILENILDNMALRFPGLLQDHLNYMFNDAGQEGYLEAVIMLRQRGAIVDTLSCTALYGAISGNHDKVVIFLLQNGADIAYDLHELERACMGLRSYVGSILPSTTIIEALWGACRTLRDSAQRTAVEGVLMKWFACL
ncbi:ankyrin repeat-containing domain protein [Aspergillus californicus]